MRTPARGIRTLALEPLRAGAALEAATDRDEIFELVLRATRGRLGFAALLWVQPDLLRGWRVLAAPEFDIRGVETLELPRTVPALEAAIATSSPSVGALATGDMFVDGLLDLLGGPATSVLVLPISVRMHTIALVVAHDGAKTFSYSDVADLFPLVDDADVALVRLHQARARTAAPRPASRAESNYDYEIEVVETGPAARATEIRELIREGIDTGTPGEDEQLELLFELGTLEATQLARPEAAIEAWRSALTIDAGDERVLDALEQLYASRGRWLDCVELIEKRVALVDDQNVRIAMLLNLAAIARERLNDPRRAAEAYERIVSWEPGHAVASPALEALYRARQEWGPVADQMLDRASREEDPTAKVAALVEVAQTYEHKVGDPRAAVLVWLDILRREPTRAGLLEEIERLAPAADAWDEVLAEARAIAEDLEHAYATTAGPMWHLVGRWSRDYAADRDDAIAALQAALRLSGGDVDRESTLHAELGELREADPPAAIAHYEAAIAGRPESIDAAPVLAALHRLYLANGAWAEIATVLPRLIDALAPSAQLAVIVDLYVELGAVYADRLARPDDAARAYHDALALDPRHTLARRSLAALYERTGQDEALLEATEAEVDNERRDVQIARYADLAAAWHEHHRYDRAADTWRKLLALEPHAAIAQQGLARSLRAGEQWIDLATALRMQIRQSPGGYDKLALLELADILATRLDDLAGATAALDDVLAREPDDPPALDALARLHDRAGRLRAALVTLERLLQLVSEPHSRADLFQRVAQIHLAARDASAARTSLGQALALDRDNADAREAMARVHLQQGELVSAGEELLRAARLHHQQADVLRCLADAAWLYRHRIGDTERARECLHRILEISPAHADAKQALAELLLDTEEWASLWPHLEEQVRRAPGDAALSPADRRDIYMKAARCAVELGKFDRALELYDRAHATAPSPAVQIERAEALYRSNALDAAVTALQALATDAQNLERAQRIAVYRRLAQIHTELGRSAQAQQFHAKILDLDPAHIDTLGDLTELHLAANRYDDAIASLRELAAAAAPLDRVALLERIGDLYRHQLANPGRAMSTYLDALELDGANRRILQRLLELQTATSQWNRAVETIAKFLDHETDAGRRAAYFLAAAAIKRTELRDTAGALEDYESALDELMPGTPVPAAIRRRALETFHQLDTIVTAERDWKYLEQAYRRMIKRIPTGDPILVPLWHALGELCRSRLEHPQSAIQAFEVAHALDPDKAPVRTRILADLYAKVGAKQPAKASTAVARLAEVDPTNPDSYRTLVRTSLSAGKVDEAWCAARALVVLKHANFDEEMLYRKFQPHEVRKAKSALDEAAWAHVRHPVEDRVISAIFGIVWESLVALRAGTAKSFDLREKERIPLEDDTRVVARIFRHASRVLAVPLPLVYAQPRRAGSLLLANTVENGRLVPAVIAGRDMMTGYRDTEIAAAVGAMVALMRPAYYLKLAMTTNEELEAAVAAAAMLVGRKVGRPEIEPLVSVFAPAIKASLTRPAAETLVALVERLPERIERLDLVRWRAAVDAAGHRAGLLVAGELEATTRMMALTGPRAAQRVQDLVAYSVSPAYFAVRQHLGVAIRS